MSDIVSKCHKKWECRAMEIELAQASSKMVEQADNIKRLRALNAELVEALLFVDRWATYKVNKPEKPTAAHDAIQIISTGIKDLVARAVITDGGSND